MHPKSGNKRKPNNKLNHLGQKHNSICIKYVTFCPFSRNSNVKFTIVLHVFGSSHLFPIIKIMKNHEIFGSLTTYDTKLTIFFRYSLQIECALFKQWHTLLVFPFAVLNYKFRCVIVLSRILFEAFFSIESLQDSALFFFNKHNNI